MKQLHVGVVPADLRNLLRAAFAARVPYYVDGDGWNVWGEAIGEDNNDDITVHVVFDIPGKAKEAKASADMFLTDLHNRGIRLVQSTDSFEVWAVLTNKVDWSIVRHSWDGGCRQERIEGTHYTLRVH